MTFTSIRVHKVDDSKTKATVAITIDGWLVLRGITIKQGTKGVYVAMPRRRTADGRYQDSFHAITQESRRALEIAVLDAYFADPESFAEFA